MIPFTRESSFIIEKFLFGEKGRLTNKYHSFTEDLLTYIHDLIRE